MSGQNSAKRAWRGAAGGADPAGDDVRLAAKISQQFCRHLQKTHYQVSQQTLRWAIAPSTEGTGKRVAESGQFRRGGAVAAR